MKTIADPALMTPQAATLKLINHYEWLCEQKAKVAA